MYNKHLQVKKSKIENGLFTDIQIPANSPIIEFFGTIWTNETLPAHQDQDMILQIGPELYMGPSGGIDDVVNHSCNPNCYIHIVGKRVILYSLYVIPAGSELTFDYSVSSTDTLDSWKMSCQCGYFKCRKVISGYQYLSEDLKKEYTKKGIVPLFISDPRFMRK